MIPAKYNVDFSGYERDFAARAQARLLQQFQDKPVIAQVVAAFAAVKQRIYDAALDVLRSRSLANASGAQLAAIGRILGQSPQFIPESMPAPFFMWDTPTLGWDNGWWGVGQSLLTTARPPTDPEFALQVLARMHLNMNRFSSIPEIQAAVLDVFGINVSFIGEPVPADDFMWDVAEHGWDETYGDWFAFAPPTMESAYLVVPSNTPAATVFLLQEFVANQRVDALPFIAWPVTFALKGVIYH
jgi:hypothetical protein